MSQDTKRVIIDRSVLQRQTDAARISQTPEFLAAMGLERAAARIFLHNVLHHLMNSGNSDRRFFKLSAAGSGRGEPVMFDVYVTPETFAFVRNTPAVSRQSTVNVTGAGVSISLHGIPADRLRAVADLLQYGTSPAEPKTAEPESAAIKEAALAKAQLESGADKREAFWKRLDAEALELDKRLFALAAFAKSADFRRLAGIDQDLLLSQEAAMRTYLRVLEIRRRRADQIPLKALDVFS